MELQSKLSLKTYVLPMTLTLITHVWKSGILVNQ